MKYVDEFRDAAAVHQAIDAIARVTTRRWNIMEICGGQTHAIMKHGLQQLLPTNIHLLHGPGCPVCVTPIEKIDQAIAIAMQPNTVLCSYGDMLRVPGSEQSLLDCKAQGADIRVIYSPLEAVAIAKNDPGKQVVLFAIGFETTAPGNAAAIKQAKLDKASNFSALVCQVTVPAAINALLSGNDFEIDGFLAAGHVCTIMGYHQYHQLAEHYQLPIVITGFE
ncbi:MAG: hydrogenase formation protein HypD, partial [Pseudomonadales bacterium]|nr:hydrogenase formation protein HypD [Pseudomonadales bacterium]